MATEIQFMDADEELRYSEEEEEYSDDSLLSDLEDSDLVNHNDWEDVSGDLTKRYNRMRQHIQAATSQNSGSMLPASNRPPTLVEQPKASTSTQPIHKDKLESSLVALSQKYAQQLNLTPLYATAGTTRKGGNERMVTFKDKSDRATNEQVMDPRTRLILFKMIGRGLLSRVEGCVSTGKEANVYHAYAGSLLQEQGHKHLAIKVYKTSILVFKDRDRYVTGEFRFKGGYAKKNPRKMVRLWAEKELRNLRRLRAAGVNAPEPIEVRSNVLVMSFLGPGNGWDASPRLKDADLSSVDLRHLYLELIKIVRVIYRTCRLVHADLSEYNILLHDNQPFIIDVSQSVEQDHPHAFDFLRKDLQNIDDFFAKRGVRTLGLKTTFELIVAVDAFGPDDADFESAVQEAIEKPAQDTVERDKTFKESFIPRTLHEVYDAERDVAQISAGQGKDLIYANLTGVGNVTTTADQQAAEADEEVDSEAPSEYGSDTESGSGNEAPFNQGPKGKKFEDKDAKKDRKQAVKEENREKRKNKMKKSEKKRRIARTAAGKK